MTILKEHSGPFHTVFLGLGSNLGDRHSLVHSALDSIENKIGEVKVKSGLYETEPWEMSTEQWFVNQVIKVETPLEPDSLMQQLNEIETHLGRVRSHSDRYESRSIDIDILIYDDLILKTDRLIIPHPRMHLRRFVLAPLVEISAELIHPELACSFEHLLDICPDKQTVRKID